MQPNASFISQWLSSLDEQDSDNEQARWTEYLASLIARAERLTRDCPPGTIEAESVASSVFASLLRGVREGRLKTVHDHDTLWWLLLAMTRRKVADRIRRQTAQKRGGGTIPASLDLAKAPETFRELIAADSTPEYAVAMQDEYEFLLSRLRDARLRQIAVCKIEGYTSKEIADEIGVSKVTIDRKLKLIRETWERELER
jgi:RNA polymerase sigma factor (sigma-70 family)